MQSNIFMPSQNSQPDAVYTSLKTSAVISFLLVAGLLPIFFVPFTATPFSFSKVLFVLGGMLIALVCTVLVWLRSGEVKLVFPWALGAYWLMVMLAACSALLSGDVADSLTGFAVETQTVAFLATLGVVMTTIGALQAGSTQFWRLILVLAGATALVQLWYLARLIFGPEALSFGVFTGAAATPVGGASDLAIFSGFVILVALAALIQLPLSGPGRALVAVLTALSLVPLALVNLAFVWIVLGIYCLVLILFLLSRSAWGKDPTGPEHSSLDGFSLLVTAVVGVVAALFIILGSQLGNSLANAVGVSYLDVRPMPSTTLDIAREVYAENVLLGIGPNRFADAWRQHRDRSLNETAFWNTDFAAGSGYVPSLASTAGVGVGITFLVFLLGIGVIIYRALLRPSERNRQWYFVASVGALGAGFLWLMSIVYVTSGTLLLLAAVCSGTLLAAYGALVPSATLTWSWQQDRRNGFVVIALVVLIILGSTTALAELARQYSGITVYRGVFAQANTADEATLDTGLAAAANWVAHDEFFARRAELRQVRIAELLNSAEPNEGDQQAFQVAAVEGLRLADQAIALDPSNPRNYALRGSLYGQLMVAGIEGARERMQAAYDEARALDPQRPTYDLAEAQFLARAGNWSDAREPVERAVTLKRNYTPALFLLSQIEIQAGNTQEAIATTRAVIAMEPDNPTRYFQLGLLLSAAGENEAAIAAFEEAVELNETYANARYLLALAYAEADRTEDALGQLAVVAETNPNNENVIRLTEQLEAGNVPEFATSTVETPVSEPSSDPTDGGGPDADRIETSPLTPADDTNDNDAAAETDDASSAVGETATGTDTAGTGDSS